MPKPTRYIAWIVFTAILPVTGCSNSTPEGEMQKAENSGTTPPPHFVKARITRYYKTPAGVQKTQSKEITDSKEVKRLASFFPEVSKTEKGESESGYGGWKRAADIRFFPEKGDPVDVSVGDPALDTYTCTGGKSDYSVRNPKEFQVYFRKLFAQKVNQ